MAEKEVQNDDSELQEQAPPAKKPFPAWAMLLIVQVVVFATYAPVAGQRLHDGRSLHRDGAEREQIHPVIHELHGPSRLLHAALLGGSQRMDARSTGP
jgi:hypothetical protein